MQDRLLLYIDILGFSNLVNEDAHRIDDLYEVIASLNAHKHNAFKCVIFSDTILVYNVDGGDTPQDIRYLIMFMCEFAKDLMHRLTNRNIFFRAVITQGHFRHYQLNEIPCFYGSALIKAHEAEKNIKAVGVFIEKALTRYSDIFKSCHFNNEFDFVFVTQALDEIESLSPPTPHGEYINSKELNWMGGPELLHLVDLLRGESSDLPEPVILKYQKSIELYRKRYPKIISCLESNNFEISSIAPAADWQPVIDQHPDDCSYAINNRIEF